MNKLGIFINFWENSWDVDHIKYMKKVKDIGFDILEFQAQPLLEMTNEHMDEMKKAAADLGIELTYSLGLDPYYDICAYDDNIIDPSTGEACLYPLSFLCDNYQIGYRVGTMAAEWTLEQFPDETGDLEFGVLWHHEFEYQQARLAGIEAAIAEKDPRIKLVDEQEGLVTEDGVKACEAWTQAFPNLKGVLATNDTCLLGYAQAWQAAGKDLKDENFGMFGNDGVNDAIDMVAEGSILRGDVGLDVYDGGAMALLACVKQLDGVETDSVILPMVSVTSENAEEDWISHPTLYVK